MRVVCPHCQCEFHVKQEPVDSDANVVRRCVDCGVFWRQRDGHNCSESPETKERDSALGSALDSLESKGQ